MRRAPVVATMFLSWFDAVEATRLDVDEHYDVVIDGKASHLSARSHVKKRGLSLQKTGVPS